MLRRAVLNGSFFLEMPWNDFLLRDEEQLCTADVENHWRKEEEECATSYEDNREAFRWRESFSDRCFTLREVVP